jgi:hypothetical protein
LCLQRILREIGPSIGIDAYQYQEHVLRCFSEAIGTRNNLVMKDFYSFSTPEIIAKVFARVAFLKQERKMSEEEALAFGANLLGWGNISE